MTPVAADGGVVAADGGVEAPDVIMNAPREAGTFLQMDSVAFPVVEDGLAGVGQGPGARPAP
ncbi:MAG: hypothetical protein OXI75_02750 [Rhodospirillales bacterium]|nr:hypothetical protein [Rhodospirillales bacterium]